MPTAFLPRLRLRRRIALIAAATLSPLLAWWPAIAITAPGDTAWPAFEVADHLVLSEVMTGGTSASDEFVELYNPAGVALPVEGLELVYVSSSGATITRKAAWAAGAPDLAPGAHLLIANEAGIFAALGDATYAGGMAAAGGSVALRIQGASSAIDAVGWGTAANTWLETTPAGAPPDGSSLERLPGGAAGSWQDSDDNSADFVVREVPDPQNSSSSPVLPATPTPEPSPTDPVSSATPAPSASEAAPTPTPTPAPSATQPPSTPAPTPSPSSALTIADARALPDGETVTIAGTATTASDFGEGGGYLEDAGAGIAVLLSDGAFARGDALLVTGQLDTRYGQRTLRASGAAVTIVGPGGTWNPLPTTTGAVGEEIEARLVAISGLVSSSATTLSTGIAYDLDDGSGPIRVLVGTRDGNRHRRLVAWHAGRGGWGRRPEGRLRHGNGWISRTAAGCERRARARRTVADPVAIRDHHAVTHPYAGPDLLDRSEPDSLGVTRRCDRGAGAAARDRFGRSGPRRGDAAVGPARRRERGDPGRERGNRSPPLR